MWEQHEKGPFTYLLTQQTVDTQLFEVSATVTASSYYRYFILVSTTIAIFRYRLLL